MKDVMKEWASRGLKPKRIRDALLQRFGLTVATVPKLTTVQRFVHHHVTGRLGGSDLIETVKTKVKEAGYTGQDEETAAFTFTSCTDGDGRPVTGKGSDVDPFVVGITSKNLLCRADQDPATFILHIDATYKLTQVVYPVVVYQQQHYTEVLWLLRQMYGRVTGKSMRIRYVMGDADIAQWNAIHEVFGHDSSYVFRMCFFHVTKKIYEKTRSMHPGTAAIIVADVHELHFSSSEADYHVKLGEVQARWSKSPATLTFSTYLSKVWLDRRVWRWQCFHTPSGFATTNNPCETYNAAIKRDVTLRRKLKRKRSGRPFATALRPDAGVVRRVRAMFRAGLLVQQSTSRNSIAFLLSGNSSESERNIVRVVSKHSPRLFDELHRHTVEDLPVSSQFNKLTARMETLGMPEGGWSIDVQDRSCPFKVWTKFGSCIHALFAMEIRGASDIQGRETLVNCSHSRTVMRAGRPKNIGRSLSME